MIGKARHLTSGASTETTRARSVIVYTPFGYVGVHPGQVFRHPLASIGLIANGNTIKRFYEASGDALTVTFPATGTGEQQNTTVVTLKRLSGIDQMMPR